jgi:small-conductance mechanosensitive channel
MNRTYADKVGRIVLPLALGHGVDTRRARDLLMEIVRSHTDVLRRPAPLVLFKGFGANSIDMEVVAFIHDVEKVRGVTSELCFEIEASLKREGLSFANAYQEVRLVMEDEQLARVLRSLRVGEGAV